MGISIGILNNIRVNASTEYQSRIPEATQNNIAEIGNALQTYTLLYNEFCNALVNKIGKTILEQKLFKNGLARFKSGTVNNAQDVEEIFIEMAKAEGSYDPEGKNPLGRRENPDVSVIYHRQNRRDKYVISIGDIDFLRVFRSEATLDSFISGLINSVYSGANFDEWEAMKNILATYKKYATCNVTSPVDEVSVKTFVKQVKKIARDMTFPSTDFNGAGVRTWSNPGDMVLLLNKDIMTEVEVELYRTSFNKEDATLPFEVMVMDNFGSLTEYNFDPTNENGEYGIAEVYAILVDKDWFRVYDTLSHMEPQRNADGLFTNYFYHVHQILSCSTFKNAVLFGA